MCNNLALSFLFFHHCDIITVTVVSCEVRIINIREIAKLAGVSIATVSRVINNPGLVQAETREHVLEVMRRENYSPAWTMASRISSRSRIIVFLFSDADYLFYTPIRSGLEAVARHHGYTVLYCPLSSDPIRRKQQMNTLLEQNIDGVIWALRDFFLEEINLIQSKKIPIILARKYDSAPTDQFNCCYINFTEASFRMTRHLLELGHRRIALMFENVSQQFMNSFCMGWQQALQKAGISSDDSLIFNTKNCVEGGYSKVTELIQQGSLPDALYCASDELAFGVLRAAREHGISVPEQLAVVGFTDSPMSNLSDPELTTIDLPIHRLGTVAARMLFDLIEDEFPVKKRETEEIILQPKLKIRRSCGNQKSINVLFE